MDSPRCEVWAQGHECRAVTVWERHPRGASPGGEGRGVQVPHEDAALTGDGQDGGTQRLPGDGGHVPLQTMLQRRDGGTAGRRERDGRPSGISGVTTGDIPGDLSPALTVVGA